MFNVGDRVVCTGYLEDGEGVIRARYRHHYLVSWISVSKWRRVCHKREENLLPSNSPIIPKLLELERRCKELEKEQDKIDEQLKELLKGGN